MKVRNKILACFLIALYAMAPWPMFNTGHAALAQTTLTQTTLSSAVGSSPNATDTIVVASATGFTVGYVAFIDSEAMDIKAVSSTTITVTRGVRGTKVMAHASGAAVLVQRASFFYSIDVSGPCTATNEMALPHVNLASGSIFNCQNSKWVRYTGGGNSANTIGQLSGNTYSADGAITIQPGLHLIAGSGALAMTLANPAIYQNGMIMILVATTGAAHTVTYTAGFAGGTTARDVATFGGAIGDNLVIIANNGVWYVVAKINVTIA